MNNARKTVPSEEGRVLLEALRTVVAQTLEKKRRLGQYVVIWRDGKPVETGGDAQRQPGNSA
ncbi:MAG: hypothetical protein QM483_04805 [Desulfuromusa sp.]